MAGLVVKRLVDVGHVQGIDARSERLNLGQDRLDRTGQRHLELVQRDESALSHQHHDAGLNDRDLLQNSRDAHIGCLICIRNGTFHAERSVNRQWIDVQSLEALHQGRPATPVERHAFLDLSRPRCVLQEEDVGLGVA